ncbi:MAG: restriction endonuclease subunit S, partial [Synergistaceae bacterium]|nr:restriction endonuclease subunit S [Synergistaceae bacterium]
MSDEFDTEISSCPEGWEVKKLGEILRVKRGKRLVRRELSTRGLYPVYQNSLAPLGFFESYNCDAQSAFIIAAGNAGDVGYSNTAFWAADDCFYFTDCKDLHQKFLYYTLLHNQFYIYSQTRRTSIPRLSQDVVANMLILFPPLHEQQAIADTLTVFDTHITNLAELIAKKKAIRDGALEDLMSGRTRLKGFSGEWTVKKLGEVVSCRKDRARVPTKMYVTTENMKQNFEGIEHYTGKDFMTGIAFYCSDILLSNIRPYLRKVYFADFCGSCSPDVLALKAEENICAKFLYYCIANDKFIYYVMSGGVKGTKMPRGDKQYIMQYYINLPPLDEQQAIAET